MAGDRNTNGRSSGQRSGRSKQGDPYTKAVQENRRSHKIVERSLNKASEIAKRGSRASRKD